MKVEEGTTTSTGERRFSKDKHADLEKGGKAADKLVDDVEDEEEEEPFYQKTWFVAVVALVIIVLVGGGFYKYWNRAADDAGDQQLAELPTKGLQPTEPLPPVDESSADPQHGGSEDDGICAS